MDDPSVDKRQRTAGVMVPVFAIRTEDDLGIGDTAGVMQMIDWASDMGMRFLQFLPINEMGNDCSPYNCISSVALEPTTLNTTPEGIQELTQEDFRMVMIDTGARDGDKRVVDYSKVKRVKSNLLWLAFSRFREDHFKKGTSREEQFLKFCYEEQDWLGDYCLFRLLMDYERGSECWEYWNEDYNNITKARDHLERLFERAPEQTEGQLAYYAYVQFIAFEQWREVAAYARQRNVKLMGDIPYGINRNSADVFAEPQQFNLKWCGGAPPEVNFKDDDFVVQWGQNWGIPLYRWDYMEKENYNWWRRRINRVSKIFNMFRIDHALGFYRIYGFPWQPMQNSQFLNLSDEEARKITGGELPGFQPAPDDTDEHRQRNKMLGERYLSMIQEAAGQAEIVAEDLGTVPEYVPGSLEAMGMAGMKVPIWEGGDNGELRNGSTYPYISMATYATHDHEPVKTQWNTQINKIRQNDHESDGARWFIRTLARWADFPAADNDDPPAYNDEVRENLMRALFETSSKYASVMITDLLGLDDRFNVPGVISDANWTHRLGMTVSQLRADPKWAELSHRTHILLKEANRLG